MPASPITTPSGYAPAFAIGYADPAGGLSIVDSGAPLPVQNKYESAPAPLSGTASGTQTVGPFTAVSSRPIVLTLEGTWQGTVQVKRSVDGGATLHPLTIAGQAWAVFTGNACEPVWSEEEDGAQFYLAFSALTGSAGYRLAQ